MGAQPPGSEVRVTPWRDVSEKPEWAAPPVAAYCIWQRRSQWGWEQRHEWRQRDGSLRMDGWIRGAADWCPDGSPVEEAA